MKKELTSEFLSRQYMTAPDFELFYYSDEQIPTQKFHSHNFYEFYFFIKGDVTMEIGDQSHPLTTGDMIFLPQNIAHRAILTENNHIYERFIFWISKEYYDSLIKRNAIYSYILSQAIDKQIYLSHFLPFTCNEISATLFSLLEEMHFMRIGKDEKMKLGIDSLLFDINRTLYESTNSNAVSSNETLYQKVLLFINNHIDEDISLDLLSNEFYASKYYIAHLFKEQFGLSIHQYIIKKRLALSRDAILNNMEISEAYQAFGFKDYSNFYRSFKKEYGISPKEYQEQYRILPLSEKNQGIQRK